MHVRDRMLMTYLQVRQMMRGERGATTAEYALILALVVVALITTLELLGAELVSQIDNITEQLQVD